MLIFEKYFVLFMIYSFFGWIMEVIVCFPATKKFVNRGFLIGPCCPIYGFGALAMIFFLSDYTNNPFALFVLAVVLCSVIEYLTSFLMEKLFKARWWDYSTKKFNIDGRVCITNSLFFGLFGLILINYVNPFLWNIINNFDSFTINFLTIPMVIFFVFDNVISFNVMNSIKKNFVLLSKDNTEEIKKKIFQYLNGHILIRRITNAFPNYQPMIIKSIQKLSKKVKNHHK